ncbi:MAG: hypothetical protein ACI8WB_006090, partial [Phenylobacterium sp.]
MTVLNYLGEHVLLRKIIYSLVLANLMTGCVSSDLDTTTHSSGRLNSLADTLTDRWQLDEQGIHWQVTDSHVDHLEFSGEQISAIIYYGADKQGNLTLKRKLVWPMLRTIPNDTHASLIHDFTLDVSPTISINQQKANQEQLKQVNFNGILRLSSELGQQVSVTRVLSPSTTEPVMIEQLRYVNDGEKAARLTIDALNYQFNTAKDKGVAGVYHIGATSDKSGEFLLKAGESLTVNVQYVATAAGQNRHFDAQAEINKRQLYITSLQNNLQLVTPDANLNKMFDFAKLRGAESIYRTSGGLMHGPGGGDYYAAIWANDQAEYINPFFPFLGNESGNESAINSFRHFARFMNDEFTPIPSSIIAQGLDIWNGAGDRGDCAMIAYGASRYALAKGDKSQATELLPLIDWCLEFSLRKMSADGVIASDSDELEGRFPTGDYNLSTNVLSYGALVSASHLNHELGRNTVAADYQT